MLPSGSISFKKPVYIIFCSHSFVIRRFKKKKKRPLKYRPLHSHVSHDAVLFN